MGFVIVNLVGIALLVGIDQALKFWASNALQPVGSMPFIPHFMELRFCLNEGAAFSMMSGKQTFLIAVTGTAMLGMAYWLFFQCRGEKKRWERVSMLLVLAGGIGNLIDRVANGCVVDYLNFLFIDFPIFNFADICVCGGVGLYLVYIFFFEEPAPEKKD